MKDNDWFKAEKTKFFKSERKSFLKPKSRKEKCDFSPKKALKVIGGLTLLGIGIHLVKEIVD